MTSPAPPAPGSTDGPASFTATFEVTANQEFLFVYLTKTQSLVVPLRVLSREQLDAFWWVVGRWAPHLVRHSRAA